MLFPTVFVVSHTTDSSFWKINSGSGITPAIGQRNDINEFLPGQPARAARQTRRIRGRHPESPISIDANAKLFGTGQHANFLQYLALGGEYFGPIVIWLLIFAVLAGCEWGIYASSTFSVDQWHGIRSLPATK
jgi:hypothetical protein